MATDVILPALGMSQDSGKIVRWLKAESEEVAQGEALAEIETDKATVEIEAPARGFLVRIAASGAEVPVGQVIAVILAPGEVASESSARQSGARESLQSAGEEHTQPAPVSLPVETQVGAKSTPQSAAGSHPSAIAASLLASRIAADYHIDLSQVRAAGQRVQKADVLAYLRNRSQDNAAGQRPVLASPKARRLARERGQDLRVLKGSGPQGAVLAADVLAASAAQYSPLAGTAQIAAGGAGEASEASSLSVGNVWRIMAERTVQSWTSVPHFYLAREVDASRLVAWRAQLLQRQEIPDVTYTDLLLKIVAAALRLHPRLNSTWSDGRITLWQEVHLGLPVAVEEGLVVPVLHRADTLDLRELTRQRKELVAKAQAGKLRPQDISGGTFTISNLGMYGVDAFNAVINEPQAAILAVGRIAERVVAVDGQPTVKPLLTLTLSCDHRAVDGARGAQFLETLASFIEEPLNLLNAPGA